MMRMGAKKHHYSKESIEETCLAEAKVTTFDKK